MTRRRATGRPNILLIMPDQHRWDAMGCAGNAVVRSPNLDRIASEGVRFGQAYSPSSVCQPARASLLTGLYPHQHGCVYNRANFPPPEALNFLHALEEGGYHTASVGKVHLGVIPRGADRPSYVKRYGFADLHEVYGKMAYLKADSAYTDMLAKAGVLEAFRNDLRERVAKMAGEDDESWLKVNEVVGTVPKEPWHAAPAPVPPELFIDNFVGDLAVEWLRRYDGEKPFFFWIGFCGPHDPHDAPQSYADPYLALGERLPIGSLAPPEPTPSEAYNALLEWFRRYSGTGEMTAEHVRRLRSFYYGNVTLIDQRIGNIVRVLEERGLFENTWIVYTSDHGDLIGDHQVLAKVVMYDGSLRVPLIVRPPGGMRGRVVDDLVAMSDAGATILDAAGLDPLPSSTARSLVPYLRGEPSRREAVFSEVRQYSAVVTDRWKYVIDRETGTPCLLFDRREDPHEDRNLAGMPEAEAIRDSLYRDHLEPFLRA